MKQFVRSVVASGLVLASVGAAEAGYFSATNFPSLAMTDTNVGVSTNHQFKFAANIIGLDVTINGVVFAGTTNAVIAPDWALVGVPNLFPSNGNQNNVSGQLTNLMTGFLFNGNPARLILSNLVAGATYEVTFYNQTWGATYFDRSQVFTGSSGGSILFNEDPIGGTLLRYAFAATNTTESITVTPQIAGNTFHFYGFSERQFFNNQWIPTGGTSFNDPTNWLRLDAGTAFGVPASVGLSASFPTQAVPTTVTVDANTTLGHLEFAGANAYTLATTNASSLTLQADPGGVSILSAPSGTHVISVPVALNNDVVKFGGGWLGVASAISGSGGLNVQKGTLSLSGTNSYVGATTVSGGTLDLQSSGALPSGSALNLSTPATVIVSNGVNATVATLSLNGILQIAGTWGATGSGAARINDAFFSGPGVITVLGGLTTASGSWGVNSNGSWGVMNNWMGGVIAQGTNSTAFFTNAITADRTVTNLYSPLDLGNLVFGSSNFNWFVTNGSINLAVLSGSPAITVATNAATIFSVLAGSQGVVKTGSGALTLLGSNTYSGGTVVNGGRLQIGVNGTAGGIVGNLSNDAVTAFVRSDNVTFGGLISGTGTVVQGGSGVLTLTNVNTYSGALTMTGGTVAVSQDANLGAASSAVNFSNAILRVNGTAIANMGAHAVNWGTFNGGFDIASAANTFTISNTIGNISAAGSFAKRGAGSLIFTNNTVLQQFIIFHQGSNYVEGGSSVTSLNVMSVGQISATMTVRGNGRLFSQSDFNVADVSGSTGILTIADSAAVGGRTLYVGKLGNAVGVLNLNGGSFAPNAGAGDWRIGGGSGTNDANAYGYVRLTGGSLSYPNNFQMGGFGLAQVDLLGSAITNNGGAPVVARYPGSRATFNILGGAHVSTAGQMIIGEQGHGVMNLLAGSAIYSGPFALGGWQNNSENGTGIVTLAGGTITTPQVRKGATNASVAIFNFNGGILRTTLTQPAFMQGLDMANVLAGGANFDSQSFNITVAQPLLAPAGNGIASLPVLSGGAGYIGPPLVTITGGGGTGATAYAQIDTALGTVTNFVVTSPGVNFSTSPTVSIAGGGGSGASVGAIVLSANTSGGLTKSGGGILTLTATNRYGGNTMISNGIVLVGNTNALGLGTITLATNTAGIGTTSAMDQSFIAWLTSRLSNTTSPGIIALAANTTNAIDLSMLTNFYIGTAGGNYTFGGPLTLASTNLYLTGGSATLTYAPIIGTGTNVFIGQTGGNTAGSVILSGSNANYASTINVLGGTLKAGTSNAFGGATATVNVASGTALDVNGQNLGAVPVYVQGTGIGGAGAIVNSGAQQVFALQTVRLTGDASIGGTQRWDIRSTNLSAVLDLAGSTLTKTGANYISIFGATVSDGNIIVGQGTLDLGGGTTVTGGVGQITVGPAGILDFFAPPTPVVLRPITINGGTITCGGSTPIIGSPITLSGATNTINTGGFNMVFTGLVNGVGSLLKTGGGTLLLTMGGSFTGATVVSGGVLELGSANPISGTIGSSGSLTINAATVLMDNNQGIAGTNLLPITINAGGTLTSSSGVSSVIAGPFKLAGGSLGGASPDPTNGNWKFGVNVTVTTNSSLAASRIQLGKADGVAFDVAAGSTLSVASTFEDPGLGAGGTGTLIKAGAGTLTLGSTNSYSGATIVSNGTLKLGGSLPAGAVARYALDGDYTDTSGNGNNGTLIGAGSSFGGGRFGQALNVTGSQYVQVPYNASLALTNFTASAWINFAVAPAGAAAYGIIGTRFGSENTFDMKYQNGKIHGDIGNGTAWLTTAADANVTVPANGWHMITYVVTNNGCQIYLNAALVGSISFSGTPLFMKTNQTMGIANDYQGGEFLNGSIDDANIYGRGLTAAEITALYTLSAGGVTNILPQATPLWLAAGSALDLNACQQSIGSLSGSGMVTNTGSGSAVLTFIGDDLNATFSGTILDGAGSIALVKNGTSTQTLSGVSTYSGGTTINGGTLRVDGSLTSTNLLFLFGGTLAGGGTVGPVVNIAGTIAPGASPGTLTILGDYSDAVTATVAIELAGITPGSGHDVLAVGGTANLGSGMLLVTTNSGFAPVAGNSFTVLTATVVSGAFGGAILPPLAPATIGWLVQYLPNAVVLSVTSAPPPSSGYNAWSNLYVLALGPEGDDDLDGFANLLEYATGANPTNNASGSLLSAARTNGLFTLRFNRDTNATDITIIVDAANTATNNADWTGIATNIGGIWGASPNVVESGTNPVRVSVADATPGTNRFLRLRVTRP